MNIENIISEIFDILLKVVRSNRKLEIMLNDDYKRALIDYLDLMPQDKKDDLCKIFTVVKTILACIDFNKLIEFANKSDIPSINVNTKEVACNFLLSKFSADKQNKKFVEKLLQKLDNVFTVIDYILKNPKEITQNANIFVTFNDDVF